MGYVRLTSFRRSVSPTLLAPLSFLQLGLAYTAIARTTGGLGHERPRYQVGHLRKRGVRNPVWVGCYRDDVIADDGRRLRRQRSVILGRVSELGKRQALQRLSERLSAINQGRQKPEHLITFQRFVLERWEPNLYPTLRYSTQRNYRWYVRRHLLPFFGDRRGGRSGVRLSEVEADSSENGCLPSEFAFENLRHGATMGLSHCESSAGCTGTSAGGHQRASHVHAKTSARFAGRTGGAVQDDGASSSSFWLAARGNFRFALEVRGFSRAFGHSSRVLLFRAECSTKDSRLSPEGVSRFDCVGGPGALATRARTTGRFGVSLEGRYRISSQRCAQSVAFRVRSGRNSARGLAHVSLYLRDVARADRGEHQSATGTIGPHRLASYSWRIYAADARSSAADCGESGAGFGANCCRVRRRGK